MHMCSDRFPKLGLVWNSPLWEVEHMYGGEVYCQASERMCDEKGITNARAVDPTVLRDLQAHRSLDDGLGPRGG
jgi:hypothetical protein